MNSSDSTIRCDDCSKMVDIDICSKVGTEIICFNCALKYETKSLKDPKGKDPNGIICNRCKIQKHESCFNKTSKRSGTYLTKTCIHCILKQKIRSEKNKLRKAHIKYYTFIYFVFIEYIIKICFKIIRIKYWM